MIKLMGNVMENVVGITYKHSLKPNCKKFSTHLHFILFFDSTTILKFYTLSLLFTVISQIVQVFKRPWKFGKKKTSTSKKKNFSSVGMRRGRLNRYVYASTQLREWIRIELCFVHNRNAKISIKYAFTPGVSARINVPSGKVLWPSQDMILLLPSDRISK